MIIKGTAYHVYEKSKQLGEIIFCSHILASGGHHCVIGVMKCP